MPSHTSFLLFHLDDLTAPVMAATRADSVRALHLAAIITYDEVRGMKPRLLEAAAAVSPVRCLAFW